MKKIIVILFLSIFGIIIWLNNFFPLKYTQEVEVMCKQHNLDKALVYAIIKVESNFREKVESPKGAVGLMQVLPSTSKWILEKNKYNPDEYDLYISRDNIFTGTLYLKYLHEKFDDDLEKVSAAYNGGSSRIKDEVWKEIEETRFYVKKVRIAYFVYRWKLRIIEVFK